MQHCDQTCTHCAREFFAWLKAREGQMDRPRKNRKFSLRVGHVVTVPVHETVSYNEAMLTAVRPAR